ncbi:hypothetical protein E1301_Tti018164 [Triplophysa tibetana]|uniref:Uncharacterized protein n=1 Tax=Triplophysa tibetana TaxID=1572043 RepID=A0A5A9PJW3_9TELE|nr:hypothetical protein E1301_Tti018164 [Triplophysa tibetana]
MCSDKGLVCKGLVKDSIKKDVFFILPDVLLPVEDVRGYTYEEAQRSLHKYLKDSCDTTDMQSDEECDGRPRQKFKPNPLYSQSQDVDSEEEGTEVKKKKIAQAPRIVMTVQGLSDVGVQCGPLHSDIKDALSLETDAHHHEPSLHQLLPAADEQVDYRPFNEMHPIGRNDIAYSKLTETLAELVSEVKELRLEVQGFMRRQLPITPALPLSLPLKSMTEFEEAERILQSEDARRVMMRYNSK